MGLKIKGWQVISGNHLILVSPFLFHRQARSAKYWPPLHKGYFPLYLPHTHLHFKLFSRDISLRVHLTNVLTVICQGSWKNIFRVTQWSPCPSRLALIGTLVRPKPFSWVNCCPIFDDTLRLSLHTTLLSPDRHQQRNLLPWLYSSLPH